MRPSIKATLSGLFALLTVITAIQGLVSLRKLAAAGTQIEDLAGNALPSVDGAYALSTFAMRARLWQFRYIMAETDAERALSVKSADEMIAALAEARTAYGPLVSSAQERALVETFDGQWQGMRTSWEALRQVDPTDRQTITARFRGPMQAEYLAATGTARKLVDLNRKAGTEAGAVARREQAEAMTVIQVMLAISFALAVAATAYAFFGVARPIARITVAMRRLADGDTETPIPDVGRRDEIGAMAETLDTFRDTLLRSRALEAETALARSGAEAQRKAAAVAVADRFEAAVGGILTRVTAAATQLRGTAQGLAGTATQTAQQSVAAAAAAEQASGNVTMVASATEELGSSVLEIGRQVDGSTTLAQRAVNETERTGERVRDLSEAAAKIGDVVALISSIAGQTNLLALNATIEAARAGEAGRGFAVVAAEVKELANQTARATDEISGQIGRIQGSTGEAVAAIQGITGLIREINGVATSIAAAVEEQGAATQEIVRNVTQAAAGTGEVTANISGVAAATGETGAAAAQVLASASELSRESNDLNAEVARFLATVRAA